MVEASSENDVVIIGAGLSGLACAYLLRKVGLKSVVLEAADRVGGRIHSLNLSSNGDYIADLGPTWVWPEYQPILAYWLDKLDIGTFAQFEKGDGILDCGEEFAIQRRRLPSQHGIRRLYGGPQSLIDTLLKKLPNDSIKFRHTVTAIEDFRNNFLITTSESENDIFESKRVIVAAPLRAIFNRILWPSCLRDDLPALMSEIPTWMAAQAKAVILYERPFWRKGGLSGRVASQIGPLVEVHDHSFPDNRHTALFGFIGWPHQDRFAKSELLTAQIERQLVRCFGHEASNYSSLHIEDWASYPTICSELDLLNPPTHPEISPDIIRVPHCGGRIYFSVTETALHSPGLIEGAFSAASETVGRLTDDLR